MVRIGHASLNELGHTTGGQKGDQKNEVCIRSWYNKPWSYLLRPKDSNKAEIMATNCEIICNNPACGYDQSTRNSLHQEAIKTNFDFTKIGLCNCDCSSFMSVCAESANIAIPYNYGNAPTTSTMRNAFKSTGEFDVYTDPIYLNNDNFLKRGDILVKEGSHTVMVLEDGIFANKTTINSPIKAVDVSKYNIINDYSILAQQINYIIIRVGYRASATGIITEDDLFKKHIESCIKNGIQNIGIYFYDQSLNEKEAIEQADWVVGKIKSYKINMPIYIDSEYSNSKTHNGRADNINKIQRTKNIIAFCNRIQEFGFQAGVYASNSWYKSMLNFDEIKQFNIWCYSES